MAIMAIYRHESVSAELYNQYRARVPIDEVPRGALAHFYGRQGAGFVTVDVWEDEDAMRAFIRDRVEPAALAVAGEFSWPETVSLTTIVTTAGAHEYERPYEARSVRTSAAQESTAQLPH
jgi:heme-degrading monooxygenase HmoA